MSPVEFGPPDEVADDAYFTVEEARALKPLDKQIPGDAPEYVYSDELIEAAREAAEQALEAECGVAFVPRDATVVLDGNGGTDLLLPHPRPIDVTACAVNGTALDSDALSALIVYRDGRLYRPAGWPAGRGNISVTYHHGYPEVPGMVKHAALRLARWLLVDGPLSANATQFQADDGSAQFFGRPDDPEPFSVAEANAVVRLFGYGSDVG